MEGRDNWKKKKPKDLDFIKKKPKKQAADKMGSL